MLRDLQVFARRPAGWAGIAALAGWLAACAVAPAEPPSASGPSELALSLHVAATPEVLPQDGLSQSIVAMTARDASARPVVALAARADILVDGVPRALGRLSARDLATGSDGRATVVYTAPPPADGVASETTVTIALTPLTGDARSHFPRTVDIKLVPQIAAGFAVSSGVPAPEIRIERARLGPSSPSIPNPAFRTPHSALRIE